jgi:hypothetical protein
MKKLAIYAGAALLGVLVSAPGQASERDFSTVAIADYVFGCMAANGQTRTVLEQCACSIDVISTIVSFDTYEQANTSMSLRQVQGDKSQLFKTAPKLRDAILDVQRAQAEAEMRCFEPHLAAGFAEASDIKVTPGPKPRGDAAIAPTLDPEAAPTLDPEGPRFQMAPPGGATPQ